jgi:uncharacterized protein YndB with AHSA1/START domain
MAMASIHKEMLIAAPVEHVWAAVRDIGGIHTRFAREFVVDTRVEGTCRLVTFANGMVVREQIVDIDDRGRRLAYSIVDGELTHHNASFQVFPVGHERSRLVWLADLLPDDLADRVDGFMEQGCAAITRTLDAAD